MTKVHELKCWPGPFQDVLRGAKRFEYRRDDRGFKVGDLLRLREWGLAGAQDGGPLGYTGSEALVKVVHIVRGKDAPSEWGIPRRSWRTASTGGSHESARAGRRCALCGGGPGRNAPGRAR